MSLGLLILVVGPSGAGKDTLIDAARERLGNLDRFVFPKRDITRRADAGGEDHNAVKLDDFEARRQAGWYALSWGAHGLFYGIPRDVLADVSEGRRVIANVSRGVIGEARRRFPAVRVIEVTVPPSVLAERLIARGRESNAEITKRLERAAAFRLEDAPDVFRFVNDKPLDEAIDAFIDLLIE